MARTSYFIVKYNDVYCGIPLEGFCLMTARELDAWKRVIEDKFPVELYLGGSETIFYESADDFLRKIRVDPVGKGAYNALKEAVGVQYGNFVSP